MSRQRRPAPSQLRFTIAKLLDLNLELIEQENLLELLLDDLPQRPHRNRTWAGLNQKEYFYKHSGHLKSVHKSSASEDAVSTTVLQEIQDSASATGTPSIKAQSVARGKLKLSLDTCKAARRTVEAVVCDAKNLSAALKAKAQKCPDSELAALRASDCKDIELACANLESFSDALYDFLADSDIIDVNAPEAAIDEMAASADIYVATAAEHIECFRNAKATALLFAGV